MKEVISKIAPDKEERKKFNTVTTAFLKQLNSKLTKAKAILGGSGKKDTWLSGSHDIDVFVKFDYKPYKEKSNNLSEVLKKFLQQAFPKIKLQQVHGSRDYFKLVYQGYNVEVIPILKINKAEEAVNITDISPLHAEWVDKKTKAKEQLKQEIRLAKQFCKANKLYGAESYIQGFSGYVLEILVIYYGSFQKLLQAATKWKSKEIVDPEKYYRKQMVLFHLNKAKTQSPLVVVDPVDKNRNAAAAVGEVKYKLFIKKAKEFLKKSDVAFFDKKVFDFQQLKKMSGNSKNKKHLVYLEIKPLTGKTDVVGAKLKKAFDYLELKLQSFKILNSGWQWENQEKAEFYFILAKNKLLEQQIKIGPPLEMKQAVKNFKQKNKQHSTKDGKVIAKFKTKFPDLKDYAEHLIATTYIKERIKKIKLFLN